MTSSFTPRAPDPDAARKRERWAWRTYFEFRCRDEREGHPPPDADDLQALIEMARSGVILWRNTTRWECRWPTWGAPRAVGPGPHPYPKSQRGDGW